MAEIVAIPLLIVLGSALGRGLRIRLDTHRFHWAVSPRLRWPTVGAVGHARYSWSARIEAVPAGTGQGEVGPLNRADLLAQETRALGLQRADSLHRPLCGAESPHAWVPLDAANGKEREAASRVTMAPDRGSARAANFASAPAATVPTSSPVRRSVHHSGGLWDSSA
jgi:hypothetical protein